LERAENGFFHSNAVYIITRMSSLPIYIMDVSGATLKTIFENDAYSLNDTNTYNVEGALRFNLDNTMNLTYRVRLVRPPLYIDGEWKSVASVISRFFKIENIQPDSTLDDFLQKHDDEHLDEDIQQELAY